MTVPRFIAHLSLAIFAVGCFSFSTVVVPWPAGLVLTVGWAALAWLPRRNTEDVWLALSAVFTTLAMVLYFR
jgi:hypothetical protein